MLQDEPSSERGDGRARAEEAPIAPPPSGRIPNDRRGRPPSAERILVVRLGALGDVLRTIPAVTALRALYPASHLAWLVEPAAASAVRAAGCVDEIVVFPRGELVAALRSGRLLVLARQLRDFVRRLRARRFELALDFHGLAKSGLLAWLSGAPIRFGHARGVARELSHVFANRRVELPAPRVSRFDRNAALVRALAPEQVRAVPDGPLLAPSADARARLEARLAALGRGDAAGFVLIHPGSSAGAEHKRYAPAAWSAVAARLADAGFEVWIAAGSAAAERALVEAIVSGCGGRAFAAPETPELDDLLALIARARVFAACDSGPLHAASLVGVPVVQLLGPTDPVHNTPAAASPWRRIHVPLPCSPCRRGCADPACMRAIPPARVAEAIADLAIGAEKASAAQGDAS
ncbi:MAG: glycosyltransferase family 9 protein [Myxococcota bacterium]